MSVALSSTTQAGLNSTSSLDALSTINNPTHPLWQGFDVFGNSFPLPALNIASLINNMIRIALSLLGLFLFLNIFYAGFLWMISGGNEEKTGTAKKILVSSVVGIMIIIFSYSITTFIISTFLGAANGSSAAI
jgi:hypothetical protein